MKYEKSIASKLKAEFPGATVNVDRVANRQFKGTIISSRFASMKPATRAAKIEAAVKRVLPRSRGTFIGITPKEHAAPAAAA